MTTKIPPCPVCGNDSFSYCKHLGDLVMQLRATMRPPFYDPTDIARAILTDALLGRALRSHGIHAVAQVDALAKIAVIFVGLYEAGKTGAYMSDSVIALCKSIKDGE